MISPMIGGLLLATGGVAGTTGWRRAGTFITLLPLLSLPALPPPPQPREHPLKSLLAGFRFLLASRLVGGFAAGWFIDDGERGAGTVSGAG